MAMFQHPGPYQPLESERLTVEAPLSFAGSTKRLLRATEQWNEVVRAILLVIILPLVWVFILSWYLLWGLWLVPYRLIRRSSRSTRKRELQHREMLSQMQYAAIATQTAIAHQTSTVVGATAPQPSPAARPYTPALTSSSQAPPGWYADPTGRHEQRYWNGDAWTDHVATAGYQSTDSSTPPS